METTAARFAHRLKLLERGGFSNRVINLAEPLQKLTHIDGCRTPQLFLAIQNSANYTSPATSWRLSMK
jgi:hypothetical protein